MAKRARARAIRDKDVNSVTKAVDVLRAFIDGQETWGVRELANALGQPGSSTHRVLQILRREGFVEWDAESRKYQTGMEFFRWWAILGGRLKVAEVAHPLMSELVSEIGESCLLGLYKAGEHRHAYVAEAKGSQPPSFHAPIGKYAPLWGSAGGLAILARLPEASRQAAFAAMAAETGGKVRSLEGHLDAVRAAGFAVLMSSDDDVPVTIGAAVIDARGNPVGSLTVAVPRGSYREGPLRTIGARVADYAGRLSRMIGAQMLGGAGIGTWTLGIDMIARLIQREIPGIGSTIWNAGGDRALQDLQNGRGAYCFAVAGSLRSAYRGEAPFTHPHGQLRAMFSLFPVFLHMVTRKDSGIRSFRDLRGKRVSAGEADFTTARVMVELMRRAGLIERGRAAAERALVYLDYAEAIREFAVGKLDVIISLTGLGDPSYRKLARTVDLRLIPLERALMETFIAHHPAYEAGLVPAATYPGLAEPAETLQAATVLVTTAERGDDEVYAATRAVYGARDRLAATLQAHDVLDPEFLFRGIRVPLHPGAERFWREQGLLDTPAPGAPMVISRSAARGAEKRRASSRR